MGRLDLIQELEVLERRKIIFENVLKDVSSRYFSNGVVCFGLETSDYNKKYKGESVKFNCKLFQEYVKCEIELIEVQINDKIKQLKEV